MEKIIHRSKRGWLLIGSLLITIYAIAQTYIPVKNDTRFKIQPAAAIKAYGFPLQSVRIHAGSPFAHAQQLDLAYLLELEPNRLLSRFYKNAGLPEKGAVYGGWESEGLSGHTLGHYLSAISMMYGSTGNSELKDRVAYIVAELARCQAARKTGYVGAIPGEDSIFYKVSVGDIESGGFDLNGGWSPWYTVHKVMAGLVDAYLYCDNKEALQVVRKMADWAGNLLKGLSDDQMQKMLRCEYGGMNDVLVNIYAITGETKYLKLADRFFDDFVMLPLSERKDALQNKHSNTNIPKGVGSASEYIWTAHPRDSTIAQFMWRTIVHHHTYANGGNGSYEYFGPEDQLSERLSDDNTETCASYNMLKLTRKLFSLHPNARLGDYYERTLTDHILASQQPETGMFAYFVPLRMGGEKNFSDKFNTFTCCVGTGMENHSKYGESIFFEDLASKNLFINLFIPATLDWVAQQSSISIESSILEKDDIQVRINNKTPRDFTFRLRKPRWSANYEVKVNGLLVKADLDENGFVVVQGKWKNGDVLTYHLDKELYAEPIVDNPNRVALFYGPVLLAGVLGDTVPDPVMGVPVLLTNDKNASHWVQPVNKEKLLFKTKGVGKPFDVQLQPFYSVYKQHYMVYFDLFTEKDWELRQTTYKAEILRQKAIAARTVDAFRIGEMQPERDHHLEASKNSYVSEAFGKHGREARGGGFFEFDMQLDPRHTESDSLLVTYIGADKNRKFDILVDGKLLVTENLKGGKSDQFYDKVYALPADLVAGKKQIRIRFDAKYSSTAGRAFAVRVIR